MPFLLLLLLTLTYLQGSYPRPIFGDCGLTSVAATWGGSLLFIGVAAIMGQLGARRLQFEPVKRSSILRRFGLWRRYHFWALLGFYLLALYLLGWGWLWVPALDSPPAAQRGMSGNMLPGMQLLLLSPFLFALISSWCCFYDIERAAYLLNATEESEPFLSRWSYVGLQARHNLLLVIPPLVPLILQQSLLYFYPDVDKVVVGSVRLTEAFAVILLVVTFVTIPLVLRLLLGLQPLPEGPLRTRLFHTARRFNFRFRDILVWNSRRTMANAMVTGPLPFLRYVVLTDRLIESLGEDEIEAVFGHEMGHVKHNHMLYYLGFMLGSMIVLSGMWNLLSSWLEPAALIHTLSTWLPDYLGDPLVATFRGVWLEALEAMTTLMLLVLVSIYVFVVFGFLSRRCERQADVFGCRTVSCDVFVHALEQVAYLNGIDRERPGWMSSWQHSTIAKRIAFIRKMSADPQVEPRFQRNLGALKWAIVFGLAAAMFALRDYIWTEETRMTPVGQISQLRPGAMRNLVN